jgi:hypothetical protein
MQLIPLDELEEGEVYLIDFHNPKMGAPTYIGTFVGVVSRKTARRKRFFDPRTLDRERDGDKQMAYFSKVVELPECTPKSTKVFGDAYEFSEPDPIDLERYQKHLSGIPRIRRKQLDESIFSNRLPIRITRVNETRDMIDYGNAKKRTRRNRRKRRT